MTPPLSKILHILKHGVDVAPEFIATANEVLATLTGDDQAKLQDALAAARVRSDDLHQEVQAEAAKFVKKG